MTLFHPPPNDEAEFEAAVIAAERLNEVALDHVEEHYTCPGWQDQAAECHFCLKMFGDKFFLWRLRMVVNRRDPTGF